MLRALALITSIAVPVGGPWIHSSAPEPRIERSSLAVTPAKENASLFATAGGDGLFRVEGARAGRHVAMVVDTGATITIFSQQDAKVLGIDINGGLESTLHTANGAAPIRFVRVSGISIGGKPLAPMDVAVAQSGLDRSLVGLDVLGKIGRLTFDRDRIEIAR